MSGQFTSILTKKIDLFFNPSMTDLGFNTSNLIASLKPDDLKRISKIIDEFISIVGQCINNQSQELTKIIKETIIEAKMTLDNKLLINIIEIYEKRINTNKYLDRLPQFVNAIKRHYARMGVKFNRTQYRLDLSSAKYEVMVKNLIRRNNEKTKTELDILLHATDMSKNNIDKKSKDKKMTPSSLPTKNIWEVIESDFDISKRAFGKKINFVADKFKRKIIFRDIEHAYMLANNGYSKPAVILAGSVIEELLRTYLKHKGIKSKKETFDSYIQTCEENGLLKSGISRLSDSVRHFRNVVHLQKEKSSKITISIPTAKGAVTSIFTIANDF